MQIFQELLLILHSTLNLDNQFSNNLFNNIALVQFTKELSNKLRLQLLYHNKLSKKQQMKLLKQKENQ